MLHKLMARDGCEQWPFNLPFHRTGLTAAAAAWAEIQSELGRRGFDQNRFPPIWSQLLLETIFGLLTGGSCGRTAEEIAGIHLTEIVLSISGTAQANITLQIDFVISSIYQPWDDKGGKAYLFVGSKFSQGRRWGYGYHWKYLLFDWSLTTDHPNSS